MKVVVITAAFPPMRAGEADQIFHLCRRLTERGLEIHVVTSRTTEAGTDLPFIVHPVIHDWSWLDMLRLTSLLKRISPEAVLLNYIGWIYDYHPMITFMPTLAKTMIPSAAFVTQFANVEGALPEEMSILTRLIRKGVTLWAGTSDLDYQFGTLLRDSDRLIVYSDRHRAELGRRSLAVNEKSILIPPPPLLQISKEDNGLTKQRGRQRLGIEADEFLLVYFGYIYPGKGVETLIKAFQTVTRKNRRVRLLILGGFIARDFPAQPNFKEEVSALPRELGIEDRVIWFGEFAWNSDDASVLLRAADACVLPFEGGVQLNNSSFAAAVSHGLPVITTQGSVLEEPFVHDKNVLLCTRRDPNALAAAIEQLIESPETMRRLRDGAAELADNWFSWENAVCRTVRALNGNLAFV